MDAVCYQVIDSLIRVCWLRPQTYAPRGASGVQGKYGGGGGAGAEVRGATPLVRFYCVPVLPLSDQPLELLKSVVRDCGLLRLGSTVNLS